MGWGKGGQDRARHVGRALLAWLEQAAEPRFSVTGVFKRISIGIMVGPVICSLESERSCNAKNSHSLFFLTGSRCVFTLV